MASSQNFILPHLTSRHGNLAPEEPVIPKFVLFARRWRFCPLLCIRYLLSFFNFTYILGFSIPCVARASDSSVLKTAFVAFSATSSHHVRRHSPRLLTHSPKREKPSPSHVRQTQQQDVDFDTSDAGTEIERDGIYRDSAVGVHLIAYIHIASIAITSLHLPLDYHRTHPSTT